MTNVKFWLKSFNLFLIILLLAACSAEGKKKMDKTYAILDTTLGQITVELFPKEAPITVKNFIELAKGEKEWKDPATGELVKRPLYNGTVFHRVIPEFMIQGGDPRGNGMGGPGYKFGDEFADNLKFDRVGRLAMANAGPGTNGSQFFITVAKTPWLNNHHTIFGQVVKGQDVADAISNAPRGGSDKPNEPIVLKSVTISSKLP